MFIVHTLDEIQGLIDAHAQFKATLGMIQFNLFDPYWSSLIQVDPVWSSLIQLNPVWYSLIQIDPVGFKLFQSNPIWYSCNYVSSWIQIVQV